MADPFDEPRCADCDAALRTDLARSRLRCDLCHKAMVGDSEADAVERFYGDVYEAAEEDDDG